MREAKKEKLISRNIRMVGLEMENPLVKDNGKIISQHDIRKFWTDFEKKGDEKDIDYFTKKIVGIRKKTKSGELESLNTDSGVGTLEMSLSPKENIHEAKKQYEEILGDVLRSAKKLNLRFLGYSVQPRKIVGDPYKYKTKKSLYKALSHLSRHNYQIPTAAQQVGVSLNLDEVVDATNSLQAVSGLIPCLFANSPIFEDRIMPHKETRLFLWSLATTWGRAWEEMRLFSYMPDKPFSSIADFFKYVWSSPMPIPFLRNGEWVATSKEVNFIEYLRKNEWDARDFYGKKTKIIPGVNDLNLAAICVWIDAKPHLTFDEEKIDLGDFLRALRKDDLENYVKNKLINCYVEYRVGGVAPKGEEMALPSLILGLVNNLGELKRFVSKFKWRQWKKLRETSYIKAMESEIGGESVVPLLEELVDISGRGLKKRRLDEEQFLNTLRLRLRERKTPADKAIEIYNKSGMKEFINFVSY